MFNQIPKGSPRPNHIDRFFMQPENTPMFTHMISHDLTTLVDHNAQTISIRDVHTQRMIDLRDQAIREALIALGWTPPPDP